MSHGNYHRLRALVCMRTCRGFARSSGFGVVAGFAGAIVWAAVVCLGEGAAAAQKPSKQSPSKQWPAKRPTQKHPPQKQGLPPQKQEPLKKQTKQEKQKQ